MAKGSSWINSLWPEFTSNHAFLHSELAIILKLCDLAWAASKHKNVNMKDWVLKVWCLLSHIKQINYWIALIAHFKLLSIGEHILF